MRALLLLLPLALGAALRFAALGQDLWLDEIWSLDLAGGLVHARDAFLLAHDNNHLLVTLWLYALGPLAPAELYRAPSLLAGIVSIALAWRIGERSLPDAATPNARTIAGLVTALAVAISYPLVVYSVEARGYAIAVFAALAIYARFLRAGAPDLRETLWLWSLAVLGILAHFSFVYFYGAFGIWSVVRLLRVEPSRKRALLLLARLHSLPALVLGALYALLLRDLKIGGGPDWTLVGTLAESLAWALGMPAQNQLSLALIGTFALLGDAWLRFRNHDDSWVFSLCAVVIVPLITMLVLEPSFLVARHLLLSIVFLSLALARVMTRLIEARSWVFYVTLALFAWNYASGNAAQLEPFLRDGRGHYKDALRYIAAHSQEPVLTLGSDHDMRNVRVLRYHARALPPGRAIEYVPHADRASSPPAWLILHSFDQPPKPAPQVTLRSGTYVWRASYPFYGPAGFHWFVYALQSAPP